MFMKCIFEVFICFVFVPHTERDELGWGGLDSGPFRSSSAKGEGTAGSSWAIVQRKQTEAAAVGQHPSEPWKTDCEGTSDSNFVIIQIDKHSVIFSPKQTHPLLLYPIVRGGAWGATVCAERSPECSWWGQSSSSQQGAPGPGASHQTSTSLLFGGTAWCNA